MQINLKLDLLQQWKPIADRLDKNARFAAARALTQTAKDASVALKQDLPSIFDRPNPFTRNSIAILPATKDKLQSTVLVKDQQAKYLRYQEEGGARSPEPGRPVVLPVNQRVNQYGNIPKGTIAKQRSRPGVFVSKGEGRTSHLPPGIYERGENRKVKGLGSTRGKKATIGRGKQDTRPKLLVSFKERADYKPKFHFRDRVEASARKTIAENMRKSLADAVRTKR